jgi:hypothetical protein
LEGKFRYNLWILCHKCRNLIKEGLEALEELAPVYREEKRRRLVHEESGTHLTNHFIPSAKGTSFPPLSFGLGGVSAAAPFQVLPPGLVFVPFSLELPMLPHFYWGGGGIDDGSQKIKAHQRRVGKSKMLVGGSRKV